MLRLLYVLFGLSLLLVFVFSVVIVVDCFSVFSVVVVVAGLLRVY